MITQIGIHLAMKVVLDGQTMKETNVGGSNVTSGKFAEQTIQEPGSYKYYRLAVNSIIKDSTNGRTDVAISEVELIGKVEIDSYPINNTTLVVANSKGIRVTHDKGNIINFTFPTNDGQRGRDELFGNLTDDKGINQTCKRNVFHSRYDDGKSAFQKVTWKLYWF